MGLCVADHTISVTKLDQQSISVSVSGRPIARYPDRRTRVTEYYVLWTGFVYPNIYNKKPGLLHAGTG